MPSLDRAERVRHAASRRQFDPSLPAQYPPDLLLEPQHIEIDLTLDLENETAEGQVTTTVLARGRQARSLTLDAVQFEDVSVSDSEGRAVEWQYDGRKLVIQWAESFEVGETRRIQVAYKVIKPVDGLTFSQPDASYPELGYYAVTDHETERARYWLPCIDLPNVRTKLDFHLTAASPFTILANGYLVEETTHDDGSKTAHWRLEQLCPSYLICFAVGDFVRVDDGVFTDGETEVPLAYFCTREHSAEDLQRSFGRTGAIMAWLTQKLDMPFPYPKYYQIALPGVFGAMENISLVSWNDRVVQDELLAQEGRLWADLVNLHEMAHSYFGDAIVCRDFSHTWLKESWAVYMEQCWLEETATRELRDYVYFDDSVRYMREADTRYKRPIVTRHFESSWEIFDAHTYPGGACRLHTLRKELGDEVFWPAVRDYLQRYYGRVVETDHFRLVLEEHSGRSLGHFFDQWFFTAGYPDLKVTFSYNESQRQGTFTVEQKQVDPESNIPAFVMNTELAWTIDGEQFRQQIKLERERQTFIVPMAGAPDQVRFDPDSVVLHKLSFNPGDALLRRQLTDAPDVIGRILAAQELAKSGTQGNLRAVIDAYAQEPFFGVRREMATALAQTNHETAVAGLADLVAQETDPMVMDVLFGAAGTFRDGRILDALLTRLDGDLTYHARSAALQAVGKQRHAAPLDILQAAAGEPGYNGIVQAGAMMGLAATRREDALHTLLARSKYGATPLRARAAAVFGLGDIGQAQEKGDRERVIETLTDLLRDPWYPVHRMAARSLQLMDATEALPALEAYKARLSYQDQVITDRFINALRAEDKTDGSALKKQVERLQEQLRNLEDRLDKLAAQPESGPAEADSD